MPFKLDGYATRSPQRPAGCRALRACAAVWRQPPRSLVSFQSNLLGFVLGAFFSVFVFVALFVNPRHQQAFCLVGATRLFVPALRKKLHELAIPSALRIVDVLLAGLNALQRVVPPREA